MRVYANLVHLSVLLLVPACGADTSPQSTPADPSAHTSPADLDAGPNVGEPDAASPLPTQTVAPTPLTDAQVAPPDVTEPAADAGVPQPEPDAQAPAPADCNTAPDPGSSPLRRLSRVEYGNTLFQLFGDVSYQRLGVDRLVADGEALGFSNQASVLSTSPLLASEYLDIATVVAEQQAPSFNAQLQQCVNAPGSAACREQLSQWLTSFGQKVYRRPLAADEISDYQALYAWEVDARGEHQQGVQRVLETLLQSPHFLYRPEFGSQPVAGQNSAQLTSWEMATRLSYLFWNTMPDVGLFEAAAADELRTPQQIEAAARRLLKAPRARLAFRNFHSEWLNLHHVLNVRHNGKELTLFPDYSDALPPELHEETLQFLDYTIFEGAGDLASVLTAPYSRMNQHTAEFYGLTGPSSDDYETVELDPERYSGVLTQAGLLMAHATKELSSPIHRGLFIRTNFLCQPPPPPPPNIPPPPKVDRSKTTREQYAAHSENATCAACHRLMDPIGLGFEHFDAMGRYRETEWDKPIDASGQIYQADSAAGWIVEAEFDGAVELGQELAESERVKACVARQWFRFAMGRGEAAADSCSMQQLDEQFAAGNYDLQELVLAITQTPAFRFIHTPGASP